MDKLSIIMYSGTLEKFIPLGVLSQAAAALNFQVNIFVAGFGLLGFLKQEQALPFAKEFEGFAPQLIAGMAKNNVPSWKAMLHDAKAHGAKIYVCSMTASAMNLKKEDFDPLVDDVVGAASFILAAEDGEVIFI
ncbi:MAG: DsrE/DsrF/DrsH-like family protein [Candidatus Micrarchaeia archaeon]